MEPVVRVSLAFSEFVTAELPAHDLITSDDGLNSLRVINCLHLKGMELAEIVNLVERQACISDQPDCGRLRHKGLACHDKFLLALRPPVGRAYCHRRGTRMTAI